MTTLVNNQEKAISQGVYAFEVTGALDLQMRLNSTFVTIKDASFAGADTDLIELPATTLKVINGATQELVTNGDFGNGTTDWASRNSAGLSVTSNVMEVTDVIGSGGAAATQTVEGFVAGTTYIISAEARTVVGGSAELLVEWSGGGEVQGTSTASSSFVTLSMEFTPLNTSGDSGNEYVINLRESGTDVGDICEFKNVSVIEAPRSITLKKVR